MTGAKTTQTNKQISSIVQLLKEQRGFDFRGYRKPMLERRIQKRIYKTNCSNIDNYVEYLNSHHDELDHLIDVFTINVSHFFRNALSFEFIRKVILPNLFAAKTNKKDSNIRIWSAGCSLGEEPYSMAILITEFLRKEELSIALNVFATDLDKKALKRASEGCYNFESIKNIKYGILKLYFKEQNDHFIIDSELKKIVHFSFYDMLDQNRMVPPDSIYGGFDIVLCRNVLIYFDLEYQKQIFEKLYRSLRPNGFLILGEAEIPVEDFKHKFKRENKCCKIYRKIG